MSVRDQEFAGYVCWTADAVQDVIPSEAVSPSDAVFLATHQPCQIMKRPLSSTTGGTPVGEEEVLSTFLAQRADLLLMPIIGQAGTGKSHLIRWLHARMPYSPDREIIYVPKYGTSLRGVIELVLAQMEEPAAVELRDSFKRAADQFSEAEAPTALLDALARTLEFRSRQDAQSDPNGASAERRWIAKALPMMLRDGVFRAHLLREGGVIRGFVEKALRGTRPGDTGDAFAFTVEDFPVVVADLNRANRDAQEVHAALSSDEGMRRLAAQMLTDQLGAAINDVFGLSGASSLSDIMRRTRQTLARADKELVILIEDFTVLQGIQRELLDALIEPATRDGVRVLCPMRVAMAVTSGYFKSLEDTIKTRAGFVSDVFVLDLPYGSPQGWSPDAVQSLVGRYLNAARLGQARIDHDMRTSSAPSNACDACAFVAVCHDSFGRSPEGYGLYPFNAAALDRAVKSSLPGDFDPRTVLGSVVRFTLDEQREAIVRGEFPGRSFDAKYQRGSRDLKQLSIPIRDELERQIDGKRYAVLLTYWGGCPSELVNLAPGIHLAFRLPERATYRLNPLAVREGGQPPVRTVQEGTALPPRVQADLDSLESWVAGSVELLQVLTNTLRTYLFDGVWSRIEWGDYFFHPGQKQLLRPVFNEYSIQIEGSPTRRESNASLNFSLSRKADVAALCRGIVLARHHGNWLFDGGDRLYRSFSNRVDQWAALVIDAANTWRTTTAAGASFVGARVAALALSARVLRIDGSETDDPGQVLIAALAETPVGDLPSQDEKGWNRLRLRASTERDQLRDQLLAVAATRQGSSGKPRAMDASMLLPIVSEFVKSWRLPVANPNDTNLTRYVRSLGESIRIDLPLERVRLQTLFEELKGYLDPKMSREDLSDVLIRAGDAAADLGVFSPPDELDAYRRECQLFKTFPTRPMHDLGQLLGREWGSQEAIVLAERARLDVDELDRLQQFCANANRRLDSTAHRLDSRLGRGTKTDALGAGIGALFDDLEVQLKAVADGA